MSIKRNPPAGREVRSFPAELRSSTDGSSIRIGGWASVTNTPYPMGNLYVETIARGAFRDTLSRNPDVVLNLNHGDAGSGLPLARTTAGNLQLAEDDKGLRFDAQVDADDPDAVLVARKVERGLLSQCSFAFRVTEQTWSDSWDERTIESVDLAGGDVSLVVNAASPTAGFSLLSARRELSTSEWGQLQEELHLPGRAIKKFKARMRPGMPGDTARAWAHAKVLQSRIK